VFVLYFDQAIPFRHTAFGIMEVGLSSCPIGLVILILPPALGWYTATGAVKG